MEKKFEFKPFDKVLVREDCLSKTKGGLWRFAFFIRYSDNGDYVAKELDTWFSKETLSYRSCIPYEGNEHLADTTDPYEPPYEPKRGDFVCIQGAIDNALYIGIFKGIRDEGGIDVFIVREMLDKSYASEDSWFSKGSKILRQATEEESQFLLEWIHEEGREWDAEKCKVVDYEWKPKERECYYIPEMIGVEFKPIKVQWSNGYVDKLCYKKGWVFKTKEECQEFCDKLDKVVSEVK